jgi:hypothetical protein
MARIKRNTRNLGDPVVPAKVGRATETKKEGAGFYLDCGGCGVIRNPTATPDKHSIRAMDGGWRAMSL